MTNYDKLTQEYAEISSDIPKQIHKRIITGALGGDRPAMSEEGFTCWYDMVGGKLINHTDILNEIIREPHFTIYREAMILGGDWFGESILKRVA